VSKILNGKKLGAKVLANVKKEVQNRKLKLKLAVVFVGDNKISKVYLRKKQEACEKTGISFKVFGFPKDISEDELKQEIQKIIRDISNSGIIIQLPLPFSRLTAQSLLNLIPAERDPDYLNQKSFDKFSGGRTLILLPVVAAIAKFFKEYKIRVKGKNAVIVGQGRLVGLPVSIWLKQQGASVVVCDKKTKDIIAKLKKADIIISGAGSPHLIKGSMVKRGAIVIDCGTSIEKGPASAHEASAWRRKTVGDVDFKSVSKKAGYLSPVPGGIGPLAVACLLENLIKLNKK
jgi:methylenetetrahydrofolate dehydrogenase (NADP+)/methenyltetrahydrofolate cyclohydrolase